MLRASFTLTQLCILMVGLAFGVGNVALADSIDTPGFDLFRTQSGATVDLTANLIFGTGPNAPSIDLEGNPGLMPISAGGDTDTIVQRLSSLTAGGTGVIFTELVALSLRSTHPVNMTGAGGPPNADLFVTVDKGDQFPNLPQPDPLPSSTGIVIVTSHNDAGGNETFDSLLTVFADLIFTVSGGNPNNPTDRIITQVANSVTLTSTGSTWSHTPPASDQHNATYPAGHFYVITIIHTGPHPIGPSLPVELSFFAATGTADGVTLRWRTESETNNFGFKIYRSATNDGNFQKIGFVEGHFSTPLAHDYTFTDKKAEAGQTYFYFIEDVAIEGNTKRSDTISVTFRPQSVPLEIRPTQFALYQNFPNPFNPETWIPYDLVADAPVSITIYNASGHRIRTLSLGTQPAGTYLLKDRAAYWDGRSDNGELASSGVYFYHLQAGDYHAVKKMVIFK